MYHIIFVSSDKLDKGSIKVTINLSLIACDFFPVVNTLISLHTMAKRMENFSETSQFQIYNW